MNSAFSPFHHSTIGASPSQATGDIRAHFSLHSIPFTREFSIDKRFSNQEHEQALVRLKQAVDSQNMIVVSGPAGAGKSVLLRTLFNLLPEARYRPAYLKVTGLGKRDLCRELAIALGLPPAGQYPTLVRRLQEAIQSRLGEALRCVLIIDEAHDIPPDVLPVFRLLTNFDMDSKLLLPIILCGQPPLLTLLRTPAMEALAWRASDAIVISNLSQDQAGAYLLHRLNAAGASTQLFSEQATASLWELTRGNMRAIDAIALIALKVAAATGDSRVESHHILEARNRVVR